MLKMQSKLKNNSVFFLFLITTFFSVFLLTINIDQYPFWDDESSVSWFAQNYNQYGKIIGYDGHNAFFYRNGALLNQNLEYNNPPLDIYYIAFIQRYIGSGDIIERGAFIALAIVFLGIFYLFLRQFIVDRVWSVLSFMLFALSISFILYSKNCRYYSIELLLGMLLIWINHHIYQLQNSKNYYVLLFVHFLASILIYLGHYTQGLAWIGTSIAFQYFLSNEKLITWLKSNKFYLAVNFLVLLFILWHIWSNKVWVRPDLSEDDFILYKLFLLIVWLIHDLNRYLAFPIWLLAYGIYDYFIKKNKSFFDEKSKLILKIVGVFIAISIIISPQNTKMSGSFDIRYVYSIFPFISIILAYYLTKFIEYSPTKGYLAAFLLIFSSILYYIPFSTPIQIPLVQYLQEKSDKNYTSISQELMHYLDTARPNQFLCIYPQYFHTQVLDYYSSKYRLVNTLDDKSQLFHASIVDSLDLGFAKDTNLVPDILIVVGKNAPKNKDLHLSSYSYSDTINVYGSFDIEIFRPELPWHYFKTIKDFDKSKDGMIIYRK